MARSRHGNYEPATVPFSATPAGEPPSIQEWAKPVVWTDRMLTTLHQGVRGGRWHTLIDKVYSPRNLKVASESVIGNKGAAGVDHQSVRQFKDNLDKELDRLHESPRTDKYRPQAVRRVWIPKPGSHEKRPLGVPTVRDRVAQTALLHVLEPIFEATFSPRGYGFRHGRGCHHALERVEELLTAGFHYVVDAATEAFEFLGHHFHGKYGKPREKSMRKFKDAVRTKTQRTHGHGMPDLCGRLNWQLRGWFNYFRHGHWSLFEKLDGWIRGRPRGILRKRRRRRGRGRGRNHQRWPNAFFDELGLYSLNTAPIRLVQSSRR